MLKRTRNKEYYYDKFHKGFVNTCMAATLFTGALLLYSGYVYFTTDVPLYKSKIKAKEDELLNVGMDLEDIASE